MHAPLAFLNGQWIAASEAAISVIDTGFVLGVTVAEQLRTFHGRVFHIEEHLERLRQSLDALGIALSAPLSDVADIALELVARNHRLVDAADDLGLSIFVTPGDYASYTTAPHQEPTLGLHTYHLPFRLWSPKYESGQAVVTTAVRQVPPFCWPAHVKCRSRLHYYLADREAAAREPGARAILLDQDGYVSEASTANMIVYRRDEGLISPPQSKILHGISLAITFEQAGRLGIPTLERDLSVEDLETADEALLTSTPLCLLPVTRCNGRSIGGGRPGKVFQSLLTAWCDLVELDIVEQARRFADRV